MKELSVGALVVKSEDIVAGIISSDQLTSVLSDILDDPDQDLDTQMRSEPISRIMTPATTMAWVEPTTGVEQCIAMMKEHRLRHLPVLDKTGSEIIGVISLKDILMIVQNGCECSNGRRLGCACCRP